MDPAIIMALQQVCGEWWPVVASVVTIAAFVATRLPAPSRETTAGKAYGLVYDGLQLLALNVGKARNAQDANK